MRIESSTNNALSMYSNGSDEFGLSSDVGGENRNIDVGAGGRCLDKRALSTGDANGISVPNVDNPVACDLLLSSLRG